MLGYYELQIDEWWRQACKFGNSHNLFEYPEKEEMVLPAVKSKIEIQEPLIGVDTSAHRDVAAFLVKVYSKIRKTATT